MSTEIELDPYNIMMDLDYGKAAMKKFRKKGATADFRIYAAGWNDDRSVMDVTGAEFKRSTQGVLDELVEGTSQTVYLTSEELQAESAADNG